MISSFLHPSSLVTAVPQKSTSQSVDRMNTIASMTLVIRRFGNFFCFVKLNVLPHRSQTLPCFLQPMSVAIQGGLEGEGEEGKEISAYTATGLFRRNPSQLSWDQPVMHACQLSQVGSLMNWDESDESHTAPAALSGLELILSWCWLQILASVSIPDCL